MKFGIAKFPGSNCDQDAFHAVRDVLHEPVEYLWHNDADLRGSDIVVLPGGFSYGDYLRCGAIARFAPLMTKVAEFARSGGLVFGICNGFQVLCECGLLPGALLGNSSVRFVCRHVALKVGNNRTALTSNIAENEHLMIPVAHGEGRFTCDAVTLSNLEANGQILFRYAQDDNPNGSLGDIAGICNERFNVFGMMPHPERACDSALGSGDGLRLFQSLRASFS